MTNPVKSTVAGQSFEIYVHEERELLSDIVRARTVYSRSDMVLISNILKPGETFVDVGANIGWHTIYGALTVGPIGHVYAFEPVGKNIDVLQKNIEHNGLEWVKPFKLALSDFNGVEAMHCSSTNFGDHILAPTQVIFPDHEQLENVQCARFDDFIEQQNIDPTTIRLFKIDAQGSEVKILHGMHKTITKARPYIIMEYSPTHISACGSSVFELFAIIEKQKFYVYRIQHHDQLDLPVQMILRPLTIKDMFDITDELYRVPLPYVNNVDLLLSPTPFFVNK